MRAIRALIVGLVGLVAFSVASGTASALTATISPGGSISATANRSGNALTLRGGSFTIVCDFTLNGTIVRSATGASGAVIPAIGSVTGGSAGACNGASSLTFLNFNWQIDGRATLGSPNVTLEKIIRNAQFLLNILGISCLYAGDVGTTVTTAPPIVLTTLNFPAQTLALRSGSGLCPSSGSLQGTLSLSPTQTVSFA